jgi:hypothetical protein
MDHGAIDVPDIVSDTCAISRPYKGYLNTFRVLGDT